MKTELQVPLRRRLSWALIAPRLVLPHSVLPVVWQAEFVEQRDEPVWLPVLWPVPLV